MFIDVGFVDRVLYNNFSIRDERRKLNRKATPKPKNQVGFGEKMVDHPADRAATCAKRQWMIFGERALSSHGGHHRNIQQFGERDQFFGCLSVERALTDMQNRMFGGEQSLGCRRYLIGPPAERTLRGGR